jgi:hypothetical protein
MRRRTRPRPGTPACLHLRRRRRRCLLHRRCRLLTDTARRTVIHRRTVCSRQVYTLPTHHFRRLRGRRAPVMSLLRWSRLAFTRTFRSPHHRHRCRRRRRSMDLNRLRWNRPPPASPPPHCRRRALVMSLLRWSRLASSPTSQPLLRRRRHRRRVMVLSRLRWSRPPQASRPRHSCRRPRRPMSRLKWSRQTGHPPPRLRRLPNRKLLPQTQTRRRPLLQRARRHPLTPHHHSPVSPGVRSVPVVAAVQRPSILRIGGA